MIHSDWIDPALYIGLENVYIPYSRFEVHTQMCTLCIPAHQHLSLLEGYYIFRIV